VYDWVTEFGKEWHVMEKVQNWLEGDYFYLSVGVANTEKKEVRRGGS